MRHIFIFLLLLSLICPVAGAAGTDTVGSKLGAAHNINVFFVDEDKQFAAQYRSLDIKNNDIIVSIMFTNMTVGSSPDIRSKTGKQTKIRIDTYFKHNNIVVASKSVYPIDFYYQQEGYIRTGNSIPLYIHSGSLTQKQLQSINNIYIAPQLETL